MAGGDLCGALCVKLFNSRACVAFNCQDTSLHTHLFLFTEFMNDSTVPGPPAPSDGD